MSVSRHSPSQTVCRMDLKFSIGIDFDDISDEIDGQGHRSKVKVVRLKNVIFGVSDRLAVAMCGMSVLGGLWGKNTDKDMSREGASTLRRFHFGTKAISI